MKRDPKDGRFIPHVDGQDDPEPVSVERPWIPVLITVVLLILSVGFVVAIW